MEEGNIIKKNKGIVKKKKRNKESIKIKLQEKNEGIK